jgi:hypothetical protein
MSKTSFSRNGLLVLALCVLVAAGFSVLAWSQDRPASPQPTAATVSTSAPIFTSAPASAAAPANSSKAKPAPRAECDVNAGIQQCCSARGCGGVVLSNRDAHNCKNTGGKSWHDRIGNCYNL